MSSFFQHLLFVLSAPDLFRTGTAKYSIYQDTVRSAINSLVPSKKKYLSDMNFLGKNIFTCKVNKESHSLAFKL